MEYRTFPGTDLDISVIVFGSWANGGWLPEARENAIGAIRAAWQAGVTTIDTAPLYGLGDAESIVGKAIACLPRDSLRILTKFGLRWDGTAGTLFRTVAGPNGRPADIVHNATRESIFTECEASLKRLKTDYIDLYQIHWPDDSTPMDETFEALQRLIEQGKVRYAGVSNYSAGQMAEAGKSMRIVSNQIHYSMLSRGLEKQTVKYCMDHDMAVLAYRPLESGLLTGTLKPGTVFPDSDFHRNNAKFSDENIRRTGEFVRLLKPLRRQENQRRPACPALDCPAPRHHRRTRRRDECRTGCRKRPGGRHPSLGQGNGLHRQHPAPSITATKTGPKNDDATRFMPGTVPVFPQTGYDNVSPVPFITSRQRKSS